MIQAFSKYEIFLHIGIPNFAPNFKTTVLNSKLLGFFDIQVFRIYETAS